MALRSRREVSLHLSPLRNAIDHVTHRTTRCVRRLAERTGGNRGNPPGDMREA
ncbi:hypothetical protein QF026_008403 [Streptomyces aurantiacus]|nr:hypothetical protein [Streptomyces aurantiacus]